MIPTPVVSRTHALLSAALMLAFAAGCTRSPLAPSATRDGSASSRLSGSPSWATPLSNTRGVTRLQSLAAAVQDPRLPGKRAIIDFAGLPGPDGRTLTADDEPFGPADFVNTFGTRVIDQEYAQLGVRFAGAGAVELTGGGLNPDGSPAVENVAFVDVVPGPGFFVAPATITFDRGQKAVTFDVFANAGGLGPSLPITLRDAKGNLVRQFQLTNSDSILGGNLPYLAGRYLVTAPTPFTSMELGLTPGGGGWFLDNLNFVADFAVPGPAVGAAPSR